MTNECQHRLNKTKSEIYNTAVGVGIHKFLMYDGKYDEREDKRKSAFNSKNKRKSN